MARLILHIGMSKSGSTALQQCLAENRGLLRESGISYFDLVRGPNHGQLGVAFSRQTGRVARVFGVRNEVDRRRMRARLRRRLGRAVTPGSTWIATSEHIGSQLRRPQTVQALADFLAEFFDEVTVVTVVRRADYWLPSAYVESVKAGGVRPFDATFVRRRRWELAPRRYLRRWQRAFGRGNVIAVPYLEADAADPQALPVRVLTAAGLLDAGSRDWSFPPGLVNVSISAKATEVLRHLNPSLDENRLHPSRTRKRAIALLGAELPGERVVLTPAAARALEQTTWLDPRPWRATARSVRPPAGAAPQETDLDAAWQAWAAQPPAPVRPLPEIEVADMAAARELLQRQRLVRHRPRRDAAVRATAAAQKLLIRVARR